MAAACINSCMALTLLLLTLLGAGSAVIDDTPSVSPAPSQAAAKPPAKEQRHRESLDVRRVRLPVYFTPKRAGSCDGVNAASITLSEDGQELEVLHLDDARLPALHALLLDTSESMADHVQVLRNSAIDYARKLPENEPAMLTSFDDDLLLISGPTSNRALFERRARNLSFGYRSNLWDSVERAVDYLDAQDRRTLLLVVSDGCDSEPGSYTRRKALLDRAARAESLTIHTIGMQLPKRCSDESHPGTALTELAQVTGGRLHPIERAEQLPAALDSVRRTLELERFIGYDPPRFGAGRLDRPAREERRWRRVEVGLRDRPGCRISLGTGALRLEPPLPAAPETPSPFSLDPGSSLLQGTLTDVVRGRGPLVLRKRGGAKLEWPEEEWIDERRLTIGIPPHDQVLARGDRMEYGWFHAVTHLTEDARELNLFAMPGGFESWSDAPFLMHGRTLLERRHELGAALAAQPAYRRWATDRLRDQRLAALKDLATDPASAATLAAVRSYLESPDWQPDDRELAPFLGDWLEDVPALRLHRASEAWLTGRLIRGALRNDAVSPPEQWIRGSESLWRDLGTMLFEAREARVLGFAIPGYDPDRDRIGFRRIVLPRPNTIVNVWHHSPEQPRGFYLALWAIGQPAFREVLATWPLEVTGVKYEPTLLTAGPLLTRLDLPASREIAETRLLRVELRLRTRREGAEPVRLRAIFPEGPIPGVGPREPLCLEIPDGAVPEQDPFLRTLLDAWAARQVPCIIDQEVVDTWRDHPLTDR
ncbi:hypothetical protein ABI59_11610 [Acidobacteria bacterium Mor1]|nr:hypothetical protein ABI59_11610 [Acidobacteria bacterium Mor1]